KLEEQISKKFVTDGIFKAELKEFLTQELAGEGSPGAENILGEKSWQIQELIMVFHERFGFPEGRVELYAEKRAKSMKFVGHLVPHNGDPANYYAETTVLRQGVLSIKMKTGLLWGPCGKIGPKKPLDEPYIQSKAGPEVWEDVLRGQNWENHTKSMHTERNDYS
ncbi:40S ribosomal protein S3, partial [Galemys pyrenaicus]